MSNIFIDFAGIFHVKDDLWRFIDTMDGHKKIIVFTIDSEKDSNEFYASKPQEFKNF